MFFWNTKDNPWHAARQARKIPPILITLLLCFALFWGYSYAAYGLRELVLKGLSALLNATVQDEALKTFADNINGDINVIAYTFTFILLMPLGWLYAKYIEGRRSDTFLFDWKHFTQHFFPGFLIGTAMLGAALGFLSIFRIFQIKGAGDFYWITFLLGLLSLMLNAVGQEYYFRGVVLSSFGANNHPLLAILAAAILSGLCNYFYYDAKVFNFFFIIDHILLGCLLGVLVFRSRSVFTAVGVRFSLMFLSQLALGIPFSDHSYAHTLFESKYTTGSIWFTTKSVLGVDTGFAMFSVLIIALALAVLLPDRSLKKEKEKENKTFFKHIEPSEKKEAAKPADKPEKTPGAKPADPGKPAAKPAQEPAKKAPKPAPEPKPEPAPADDDEDWEEEETRDIGTPNYKAPEEYLKK